jgi:DMSO reductase anchor subunit
MHPALSVIFFTSLSGAGYGILAVAGVFFVTGLVPFQPAAATASLLAGLGLASAGLLISTAHLHHPERAWRALSQWRSSWLSREGVISIATYLPAGILGYGWFVQNRPDGLFAWAAWATVALALMTVFCTARIYASLRTIRQWHHPLVVPLYLLFSLATGGVFALAILGVFGSSSPRLGLFTLVLLVVTWMTKWLYWRAMKRDRGVSTASTATGLSGEVRVLDPAHTGENYLMKEMGYRVAQRHAAKLHRIAWFAGFIVPAALVMISGGGNDVGAVLMQVLAACSILVGVFVERWLFFAEARHTVMLYYGADSA